MSTDISLVSPDVGKLNDPYEKLSMVLQLSMYNIPAKRIPMIIEECKRLNVDGVLDRFHVGCRTVAGDAMMIKDAITRELGLPVLLLERDDFDPRGYNQEQYKDMLDSFRAMLAN